MEFEEGRQRYQFGRRIWDLLGDWNVGVEGDDVEGEDVHLLHRTEFVMLVLRSTEDPV